MHADLMLLYLIYLWIMISTKTKSWAKLLSFSLPSSFRGHPGLAKYHTVWATFSRYFLLDAFLLACAIQIVIKCLHQRHNRFLANYLNSLIVGRTGFMLTESTIFSRTNILPAQIYKYHFC